MCRSSTLDEVEYVDFESFSNGRTNSACPTSCCSASFILALLILLAAGVHASKEALVPSEPALEKLGLGPFLYSVLNIIPIALGMLSPLAWGTLWDRSPSMVFVLAPCGELCAAMLTALGLHTLASHGSVYAAGACVISGLVLSSACRAGITIAEFTTCGRICSRQYAMLGFGALVLSKHFTASVMSWLVPRILSPVDDFDGVNGFGRVLHVQLTVLFPHVVAVVAGLTLARIQSPITERVAEAVAEQASSESKERQHKQQQYRQQQQEEEEQQGQEQPQPSPYYANARSGWYALVLLGLWRALEVGTLHTFHTMRVELATYICALDVKQAGSAIALNDGVALALVPAFAWLLGARRMRVLLMLLVWIPLLSVVAITLLMAGEGRADMRDANRVALLVMSILEVGAPIIPLAMLPASVAATRSDRLGTAYGLVESLFTGTQIGMIALLGLLREADATTFVAPLALTGCGFTAALFAALALLLARQSAASAAPCPPSVKLQG